MNRGQNRAVHMNPKKRISNVRIVQKFFNVRKQQRGLTCGYPTVGFDFKRGRSYPVQNPGEPETREIYSRERERKMCRGEGISNQ